MQASAAHVSKAGDSFEFERNSNANSKTTPIVFYRIDLGIENRNL